MALSHVWQPRVSIGQLARGWGYAARLSDDTLLPSSTLAVTRTLSDRAPTMRGHEMTEPNNAPDERREEPKDDHLDVTAQYGGGNDWETAPTGLRAWWRRLRGK